MADISDLTYNVVACNEILAMLWKRLNDDKNWRHVYKVSEGENWRERSPGLRNRILSLLACSDWLNIYSKWSFLWLYCAPDHVTRLVAGFFSVSRTIDAAAAVFDYVQAGFSIQLHCHDVSSSDVYLELLFWYWESERQREIQKERLSYTIFSGAG